MARDATVSTLGQLGQELSLAQVPFLDRLAAGEWFRFLREYEAYQARGGQRSVRELVSASALRVISLRVRLGADAAGEATEEASRADPEKQFVAAVSALFAPRTVLEAYDRFIEITMSAKTPSVDAVLSYLQAYDRQEVLCQAVLPPAKKLQKLFVRNLRPQRLSERVEFKEPKTLEEAKRFAVEEAEYLVQLIRETAKSQADAGKPEKFSTASAAAVVQTQRAPASKQEGRAAPVQARVQPSQPGFSAGTQDNKAAAASGGGPASGGAMAATYTCFACGKPGHRARECPNKGGEPAWQRDDQGRLTRKEQQAPVKSKHAKAVAAVAGEQGAAAGDGLRRVLVTLKTPTGTLETMALLDSGATHEFVSSQLYDRLLGIGVLVQRCRREVRLMTGTATAGLEVRCSLRIDATLNQLVGRTLEVPVTLVVVDEADEELVLGMPLMEASGLNALLAPAPADGTALEPTQQQESDEQQHDVEDEELEEYGAGHDGTLPTIAAGPCAAPLRALVEEYQDVFGELPAQPAKVPPMTIQFVSDKVPKPQPPRRTSPAMQQVIRNDISKWLELGIVKPSSAPFSAPIVVVKKKGGEYRTCVDYRDLNNCTVDMKYPLQNTKTVLERMAGRHIFGTLDLRSGFHQVPIAPDSQQATAFATSDGLYEFTRVQFGLKNGPAYFQQIMSEVLHGLVGHCCEVFIDDIIIYADDAHQFVHALRQVFQRLREHDMRLKGSKCQLGLAQVAYLGHVVDGTGIALSEERKQGLIDLQPPKTTSQLRSFMGMAGYFRTFIQGFATVSKPLHRLCSDKVVFSWSPTEQQAFDSLKTAIQNAPMLHHLDYSRPIILQTDASAAGIGGVLLQRDGNKEQPVCFVSKAFSEAEAKWSTIEQEAFGIFYCVITLQHYLLGHHFTVETDHRNLVYIHRAVAPKIVRWRLRLQEFDFDVVHIAGKDNNTADALSRCLLAKEQPHTDDIAQFHNALVGHRGVRLTEQLLREGGREWPTMRDDIAAFVNSCPTCQKVRLGQGSVAAALATTAVYAPFEVVAVDTIGPLPTDSAGNKYVIVAVDCFSRFVELRAAPDATAREAAQALLDVFGRYGAPRQLRSDNGTQYTAQLVKQLLQLVGTTPEFTIPYRPESNGIVERANQEIGRHLRAIVFDRRLRSCWSETLPLVQRIVNATPNSTTGTTPARIMFGDAVQLDRALVQPFQTAGGNTTYEDYVQQLSAAQQAIVKSSEAHLRQVVKQRVRATPEQPTVFQTGDYVLASYPERPPSKLTPQWRGPLVVVHAVGTNRVLCQDLTTLKNVELHVERLKRYCTDRTEDPVAVAAADKEEFEVEAIVDHRTAKNKSGWQFRVRWRGYEPEEDSWLPYKQVKELAALDAYLEAHPELRL